MAPTLTDWPDSTTQQPAIAEIEKSSRHNRTTLILLLLLLVHVGWIVWKSATNMPTIDFLTFWSVPHALSIKPITNIYSAEGQREMGSLAIVDAQSPRATAMQRQGLAAVIQLYDGRIESTATPVLYTLIARLSSGNYATDQKRFVFVCTMCLVLSMWILKKVLRFSILEISLLFIFIATYYAPVLIDRNVGNINEIELLGLALFIFFTVRSQPLLAGLAIGAAMMVKPLPVMVLVLILIAGLIDREYRQLVRLIVGCLMAAATCFLLSLAYFRTPTIWFNFFQILPRTVNGVSCPTCSLENGNFSLSALLFGATTSISAIIPLFLLAGFSWLWVVTRQSSVARAWSESPKMGEQRRMHMAFAVTGGGSAIMLLSSPLVWAHYFVLLLPLLLYLMRPSPENPLFSSKTLLPLEARQVRRIAGVALPFVILMMFSFLSGVIVGDSARITCYRFVSATILTLGLAFYRIWQERRALTA